MREYKTKKDRKCKKSCECALCNGIIEKGTYFVPDTEIQDVQYHPRCWSFLLEARIKHRPEDSLSVVRMIRNENPCKTCTEKQCAGIFKCPYLADYGEAVKTNGFEYRKANREWARVEKYYTCYTPELEEYIRNKDPYPNVKECAEEIYNDTLNLGLTVSEICRKYSITLPTVCKIRKLAGIKTRKPAHKCELDKRIKEVKRLVKQTGTLIKAAKILGVNVRTFRGFCRRKKIKPANSKHRYSKCTRNRVLRAFYSGKTKRQIAEETGVPYGTLNEWIRKEQEENGKTISG